MASDNPNLATSASVFIITSVNSQFKEVIHITPVSKVDYELLHFYIRTLIVKLEEIGYRIFCVVSDNNSINSKAMNNFSPHKKLSIVYPHPVDKFRPLFFLFDSVHLLKCIRNNWLNSKPDQTLYYPHFQSSEKRVASFRSLKKLHELENSQLLKFGYTLSLK